MYCKLFASLYQGTLRGKSHEILVFTNLLANADSAGHVDIHFRAIADEVGLTVDEVKAAIRVLESPDPESRSPEHAGARLVKMDGHREWGWKIVNYLKYRSIRSEEDRREQNRLAQERFRNKSNQNSKQSKPRKPKSAQAEAEAEAEDVEREMPEIPPMSLEDFNNLAAMRGISPECAEWFWNICDGRNWLDAMGQPIRKVEPLLLNAAKKWRAKTSTGKPIPEAGQIQEVINVPIFR